MQKQYTSQNEIKKTIAFIIRHQKEENSKFKERSSKLVLKTVKLSSSKKVKRYKTETYPMFMDWKN